MNNQLTRFVESKAAEFDIEEKSDRHILRGFAAVFDTPSGSLLQESEGFSEIIERGFFRRALGQSPQMLGLIDHNTGKILGSLKAKTLGIDEVKRGLFYEVEIPDTQYARDAMFLIQRGDIYGNSWRSFFDPEMVEYDRKRNVLHLMPGGATIIRDVGPVSEPVYPDAEIETMRKLIPAKLPDNDSRYRAAKLERMRLERETLGV